MAPGDTLVIALYRSTDGRTYSAYTVDGGRFLVSKSDHATRRGALETLLQSVEEREAQAAETQPVPTLR